MKQIQPHSIPSHHDGAFSRLPLRDELQKSLATLNYTAMTPIQMQCLPRILNNIDVIAQAETGSGKTVAFGLALLNRLEPRLYCTQALVLCPTRELAEQVSHVLRRLACFLSNVKILNVSGGIPLHRQRDSLKHGAHIIVGTPGRVQKLLDEGTLLLAQLSILVLDEADRMLDMGFFDSIKAIISFCSKKRQTLLFSATYPDAIKQLATPFMQHPEEIRVQASYNEESTIEQRFYEACSQESKFSLLKTILLHYQPRSTLIFCNTKQQTIELTEKLVNIGFSACALNGDMEQIDRDLAMMCFSNQSCSILVATDVAARGLDIKELPAVINFDLAFEPDIHIHRIGRTGRAGNKGLAISLSTPADAERLCAIERHLRQSIQWGDANALKNIHDKMLLPTMVTLCLGAGKKDKLRPGDILGALIKEAGLPNDAVGKITITLFSSYVAIHQHHANKALHYLQNGTIKGRNMKVKRLAL